MEIHNHEVIVLGAGLTGLTTAMCLQDKYIDVGIVEKSSRVGGKIATHRLRGFLFESGPTSGVIGSEAQANFLMRLGDIGLIYANQAVNSRWIWHRGRFRTLPTGIWSGLTTPLFSWRDKLTLPLEWWRKRGENPDECVADTVRRRLGRSICDYAVDPFINGIYAGDAEMLVTRHALPKLYQLEQRYGSFLRGGIAMRKVPYKRGIFSFENGMQTLTDVLASRLSSRIYTSCRSVRVQRDAQYWQVHAQVNGTAVIWRAKQIISTLPATALATILPFIASEKLQSITQLRYAPVVQIAVGVCQADATRFQALGGLIPTRENSPVLGILFPSAIFPHRAPPNGVLLSLFIGGIRYPEWAAAEENSLTTLVAQTLKEKLGITQQYDILGIFRHLHAIAQYEKDTDIRLDTIATLAQDYPGLVLAGGLCDGVGIGYRIEQAINLARW